MSVEILPPLYERLHGRNPHGIRLKGEVLDNGVMLLTAYVTTRSTVPQDVALGKRVFPGAEWTGVQNGMLAVRYRVVLTRLRSPDEIARALADCDPAPVLRELK